LKPHRGRGELIARGAHGAVQLPVAGYAVAMPELARQLLQKAVAQIIRDRRREFLQCLDLISTEANHRTHSNKLIRPIIRAVGA
jgi:hypothetical protein